MFLLPPRPPPRPTLVPVPPPLGADGRCIVDSASLCLFANKLTSGVVVNLGFAQCATFAWGGDLDAFSSLWTSFMSMFLILVGEFGGYYEEMVLVNEPLTNLFMIVYIVLLGLVALNIFLAIVVDSYSQVKAVLNEDDSEMTLLLDLWYVQQSYHPRPVPLPSIGPARRFGVPHAAPEPEALSPA